MARKVRVILMRLGSLCLFSLFIISKYLPAIGLTDVLTGKLKTSDLPDLPYSDIIRNFIIAAWRMALAAVPERALDNIMLATIFTGFIGGAYFLCNGFSDDGPDAGEVWGE